MEGRASGEEDQVEPRIDYRNSVPKEALDALYDWNRLSGRAVSRRNRWNWCACGLRKSHAGFANHMRASQINGCAYCLDMHSKDARAEGETERGFTA
jgi:hypothetical protein